MSTKCKTAKTFKYAPPLRWRRPFEQTIDTSRRRVWLSRCGHYRVVRSESNYGLPTVYYAMRFDWPPKFKRGYWTTVSRHRKRARALRACEADAKHNPAIFLERIKPR